jgi:hypothetical protein
MEPMIGVEPRGQNIVLFETNAEGLRQEMVISRSAALQLSRLLPSFLRKLVASTTPRGPNHSVSLGVPVKDIRLVEDVHHTEILLNITDVAGGDFDYSMDLTRARNFGRGLIERADFADRENAKKTGH